MSRISTFFLIISKILLLSSLFFFICILTLFALKSFFPHSISPAPSLNYTQTLIQSVHDGDTIYAKGIKGGIRLIGIDAPELAYSYACMPKCVRNECGALEARDRLKNLILNHEVVLENDTQTGNTDIYGRLLRYVFLCPTPSPTSSGSTMNHELITLSSSCLDISFALIQQGLVEESGFGKSYSKQKEYQQAENEAKSKNIGLWAQCK